MDDVYVVGCGPSLKGFDWKQLEGKTTIAVNGAVCDVPNPDYFVTADSFFAGRAVAHKFWGTSAKKVLVMAKDHKRFTRVGRYLALWDWHIIPQRFDGQIGFSVQEFATGQNSGFCGLQLAVVLGAKRIHLLGMDFHTKGGQHYHDLHRVGEAHLDEFFKNFVFAIKILQDKGIQVINHSENSRLNVLLPCEPMIKPDAERMPIVVSHYTKGTGYEEEVKNLIASLNEQGLQYDIEGIETLGSWRKNSNYCTQLVQKMFHRYPDRDILRVDADAVFQRYPSLFLQPDFTADVAAHIHDFSWHHQELLGGTIFFRNRLPVRELVDEWAWLSVEERPTERNPDLLKELLDSSVYSHIDFQELPPQYCKIFDLMKETPNPVIEHFQASRRFKKHVNHMSEETK
jgi:hypothetical protein